MGPPACRFLFFVDTSRAMAKSVPAIASTVGSLIASGGQGRMRAGDAFAVWHLSDEPFQFEVPIQIWTPDDAVIQAERTATFLRNREYTKRARAETAFREMFLAMKNSESLTTFLISNGEIAMLGTPFDLDINKAYLQGGPVARKEHKPLVTMLRAENRLVVDWAEIGRAHV